MAYLEVDKDPFGPQPPRRLFFKGRDHLEMYHKTELEETAQRIQAVQIMIEHPRAAAESQRILPVGVAVPPFRVAAVPVPAPPDGPASLPAPRHDRVRVPQLGANAAVSHDARDNAIVARQPQAPRKAPRKTCSECRCEEASLILLPSGAIAAFKTLHTCARGGVVSECRALHGRESMFGVR
jgi:hypothetical protein